MARRLLKELDSTPVEAVTMSSVWRCPRCGAVAEMDPRVGEEVVAVYDLCGTPDEPRGPRAPVRMERVEDPAEIVRLTAREPALRR